MINTFNEKTLHADIKQYLFEEGDQIECDYEGFVIDIKRNDLLIEIQTKNFSAMKKKLAKLLDCNQIRLVYPIIKTKMISVFEADGKTLKYRRASPVHGNYLDIFEELIYITHLVDHINLEMLLLLISAEEKRIDNGKGSWRRKGISIDDRKLLEVHEQRPILHPIQLFNLLPDFTFSQTFSTKDLIDSMQISKQKATKICYVLKKIGLIKQVSKKGNLLIYKKC